MTRLHDDELLVDADLAQRLVSEQFPQWAHLSVRPLGPSGSSNALFRLGEELLVRLPRQPGGGSSGAAAQGRQLGGLDARALCRPARYGAGGPRGRVIR